MAERLNAHDSKSCYAGMYTRVQIPFSAPNPKNCWFLKKLTVFLFAFFISTTAIFHFYSIF